MRTTSYPIYKGLQKPLTYKGFKGKYIYWALASLLLGLLIGAIAASLSNILLAALCSLISMGGSIAYILHKQKNGPYSGKAYAGIFVPQTKLLLAYDKPKQACI